MTREEIIIESRRRAKAGEFNRRIMERKPSSHHFDEALLECGHRTYSMAAIREGDIQTCQKCIGGWIKEQEK